MRSDFFKLNWRDLGKGLVVAVITAVLTYVYTALEAGDLTAIDWKVVGTTAIISAVGYLFKNLVTNSDGELTKVEDKSNPYN